MAESAPAQESMEEAQVRVMQYLETKAYVDNPELLPWYKKDLAEIKPKARDLLENYCKIAPENVEAHVKKVRDNAFQVYPYPCLGNWGFLNLSITESPVYKEVLDRLKDGQSYLDIGCCMGQDIRKLVYDGAPTEKINGSDLKKSFWDISFDLFLDKETLNVNFIEADVFDTDSGLKNLDGKLDIVNAASFFHLFDLDGQIKAAKRVVRLLKAEPGVMLFGRQGGQPVAGDFSHIAKQNTAYWHSPESWIKMWKQVAEETDSKWDVQASLGEEDLTKRMGTNLVPAGTRFMTFVIRRV